jgi:hypothetical protein
VSPVLADAIGIAPDRVCDRLMRKTAVTDHRILDRFPKTDCLPQELDQGKVPGKRAQTTHTHGRRTGRAGCCPL